MDPALARLVTDLVEKIGLLRRDLQHRGDLEPYAARIARIERKVSALAEHFAETDPELAAAVHTAWRLPARSLAFRNAAHRAAARTTSPAPAGDNPGRSASARRSEESRMAEFSRHVVVDWTGTLMDGSGTASAGTGAFSLPVTFPSRIGEGDDKTTPEELLAGAHAACFTMVLASTIGKKGGTASKVRVTATVTADKGDAGITVVSSMLKATVTGLEGIEAGALQELATGSEKGCPISNAIRGSVNITVEATAV
jgi:osmotically inducible protein OsmC